MALARVCLALTHEAVTSLRVLDDSLTFGFPPSPNQTDAITPPTNPTKCFTTARVLPHIYYRQAYHTERPFGTFFHRQCGTEMPFPPRGTLSPTSFQWLTPGLSWSGEYQPLDTCMAQGLCFVLPPCRLVEHKRRRIDTPKVSPNTPQSFHCYLAFGLSA
ncbi:hypothetical protein QR685DRAFT_99699 [Neurospora intermedia]|uniref:Secreted protein n=1 Tax=Neurospora intermedia TaxID=5142 RepID=A0ABR3D1H8_NEUIN